MSRPMILVSTAFALSLGACMKNDCGDPNNNAIYQFIEARILRQKAAENGPSVRWYWCEAPMKKGALVPMGRLGPLVNLFDGSDYGYGGWVRVLADETQVLWSSLVAAEPAWKRMRIEEKPVIWAWTAAAIFGYAWYYDGPLQSPPPLNERLSQYGADTFAGWLVKTGKPPLGVRCYSVPEVSQYAEEASSCLTPAPKSPVSGSGDTTSSSASGGSRPPGDWGSN